MEETFPNTYKSLVNKDFIIEDDRDEYEELYAEYKRSINSVSELYLTILPTLDCNLRCWYCFEKHKKGTHLTTITANAIVELIKKTLSEQPKIQAVHIELFGGEPLLYFKSEVYPLLHEIKKCTEERQRTVSFFFVTNSVCILPDTYPLFQELHANFQISIDGYKEKHDKIKFIPNENKEGTYSHVINVIKGLTTKIDGIYINLRINYDDETLIHMEELISDLKDIDRRKIGIHLERIWQTSYKIKGDNELLKSVIDNWQKNGFRVSYMNLSRRSYSCKASKISQCAISYNGAVYKCTGRDFTSELKEEI